MNNFTLIRHGEANYDLANERKLIGGVRDWVPLTENGVQQITQLCETLKTTSPDILLTSPMTRAMHTSAIISRLLNIPFTVEFDLHEWLPDLTYRYNSSEEALTAFDEYKSLNGNWPENEKRNWEPVSQFRNRILTVLQRYRHSNHVFVVCHGAIIDELCGEPISVGQHRTYHLPEQN